MKKVRLVKGLSYRGHGVYFQKGKEKPVEDAKAEELVSSGFFEIAGDAPESEDTEECETEEGETEEADCCASAGAAASKPVSKMNGTELRAYAEAKGYDISDCTKVEEIRELVEELDAQ